MLISSAKSRSARGAYHRPAVMGSCLTICHKCLPYLPSGKVSPCVPDVFTRRKDAWGAVNVRCG